MCARGRIVDQCSVEDFAQLVTQLDAAFQLLQKPGLAGRDLGLQARQQTQRARNGRQVARRSAARADTRGQALQVGRLGQARTQILAQAVLGGELGDAVQTCLNRRPLGQGGHEPLLQQPRAHGRNGAVEGCQERAGAVAIAEPVGQFQAAARHVVEQEEVLLPVGLQAT